MADYILVEKSEGVAILTIESSGAAQRPQQSAEHRAARGAITQMSADDEIGCIVITGSGTARVLGRRRHPRAARGRPHAQLRQSWTRATPCARAAATRSARCPKPTIGMINGLAYGGAGVLASSLDMRVGCEHASFRFLAAAYGRINSTWTLPNQVGWPVAKELLVLRARRGGGGGAPHRPAQPPGAVRGAAGEDDVAGHDDRQEPPRGGRWASKALLLQDLGRVARGAVGERAELHHQRRCAAPRPRPAFPDFIARRGGPCSARPDGAIHCPRPAHADHPARSSKT